MLELDAVHDLVGPLDEAALVYPWSNPDPRVDELHAQLSTLVQRSESNANEEIFREIWQLAHEQAGLPTARLPTITTRPAQAQLSEPWYCCAEPTDKQMAFL